MTQITEAHIQNYENQKAQLEAQIQNQQREKIIIEEQVKQQQAVIMQTFGTVDPTELAAIADNYQTEVNRLGEELLALDSTFATA